MKQCKGEVRVPKSDIRPQPLTLMYFNLDRSCWMSHLISKLLRLPSGNKTFAHTYPSAIMSSKP